MAVFYATNSVSEVAGQTETSVIASTFDSTYVSNSIRVPLSGARTLPMYIQHNGDQTGDTIFCVHFDANLPSMSTSGVDGSWLSMFDSANRLRAYVDALNGTFCARIYDSSGGFTNGAYVALPTGLNTFDVYYSDDGANCTLELYSNGVLITSATRASIIQSVPNRIQFDHSDMTDFTSQYIYYSQIIVANESTVGMKVEFKDPAAAGNYTALSATVTEVADDDVTTGWSGDTATDKQSYTIGTYTPPASRQIHSVLPTFDLRVGATGPQNILPFVRISATDYDAPADIAPVNNSKQGIIGYAWSLNPATGVAWTGSDVSGMEAGLQIKT